MPLVCVSVRVCVTCFYALWCHQQGVRESRGVPPAIRRGGKEEKVRGEEDKEEAEEEIEDKRERGQKRREKKEVVDKQTHRNHSG